MLPLPDTATQWEGFSYRGNSALKNAEGRTRYDKLLIDKLQICLFPTFSHSSAGRHSIHVSGNTAVNSGAVQDCCHPFTIF